MNNTEGILEVLWGPEEDLTPHLRLRGEWGLAQCRMVREQCRQRSRVGQDIEVRKKAQYFEEAHCEWSTEGKR